MDNFDFHDFNSMLTAIRKKCIDCVKRDSCKTAVFFCGFMNCPLWEYRLGYNPDKTEAENDPGLSETATEAIKNAS